MTDGCKDDMGQFVDDPHSAPEPRDVCQPLLQEHNGDSSHHLDGDYEEEEEDDDDDDDDEDEEEEEDEEEYGEDEDDSGGGSDNDRKKGSRRSQVKKMRKLADLFAMVQSMNSQSAIHHTSKARRRKRGFTSEPVVCDYCPESFVCFASLNTHSKKEHGVNLLQCTECGRDCNSLNLLKVHIKMKHEKKRNEPVVTGRFPCETCGIKYQTESALILHKYKTHDVKLAIICPFCDRVFNRVSNAENLYNHTMKEHQDRKTSPEYIDIVNDFLKFRETSDTFCCKTCNKSFESSYKLKSHQYKVHNEREASFLCDKCDKVFKFRGELNFHYQKYHSGVIFVCPDCGKTFNHKYNLEIHIKMVHVKNKTLSCDLCGKMFFIPSKLEHHRRTVHEKLKPFQCEFCGFRCAAHGNLNLHRKTQHGADKLTIAEYNKKHGIVTEKKPGGKSHTQTAIAQGIAKQTVVVSSADLEPQYSSKRKTEEQVKPEVQKEEEGNLSNRLALTSDKSDQVPSYTSSRTEETGGGGGQPAHYQYLAPLAPLPPSTPYQSQHFSLPAPPHLFCPPGPPATEYYLLPNMTPWQTVLPAQTNQH